MTAIRSKYKPFTQEDVDKEEEKLLTEKQLELLEDMKEYTKVCPACLAKFVSDFARKNRINKRRDAKAAVLKSLKTQLVEKAHAR